jgi:hypothetical protein
LRIGQDTSPYAAGSGRALYSITHVGAPRTGISSAGRQWVGVCGLGTGIVEIVGEARHIAIVRAQIEIVCEIDGRASRRRGFDFVRPQDFRQQSFVSGPRLPAVQFARKSTSRIHSLIARPPASASSFAYSSSLTFVPMDFLRNTGFLEHVHKASMKILGAIAPAC